MNDNEGQSIHMNVCLMGQGQEYHKKWDESKGMSEFEKAPLFGEDTTLVEQHQRSSSFKKLLSKEGKILVTTST